MIQNIMSSVLWRVWEQNTHTKYELGQFWDLKEDLITNIGFGLVGFLHNHFILLMGIMALEMSNIAYGIAHE